jgi:NhaA family Na+:H+ antiporter
MRGWAVPVATDIAFAVGVLALLGKRVPYSLKVLLLSIAIIDDLAAIIIIAIFYTESLSMLALGYSLTAFAVAVLLNRAGVKRLAPYILIGVIMWLCVLKSGVHATLAGVFLAMTIPLDGKKGDDNAHQTHKNSPLVNLEHMLKPWVAFMIMPLFAFANAGLDIHNLSFSNLADPVPAGIILGLFFGKQIGIFLTILALVKLRICQLPDQITWPQVYGLSFLCGIGFTMSLFIGSLAFGANEFLLSEVRLGVLTGSTISAICGFSVLYFLSKKAEKKAASS